MHTCRGRGALVSVSERKLVQGPHSCKSYDISYILGFGLVKMAISTNPKPTIYCNVYENTSLQSPSYSSKRPNIIIKVYFQTHMFLSNVELDITSAALKVQKNTYSVQKVSTAAREERCRKITSHTHVKEMWTRAGAAPPGDGKCHTWHAGKSSVFCADGSVGLWHTGAETLHQCWLNVGPVSQTLNQHRFCL